MNTTTNTTATRNNSELKATLIAFGIFAIIAAVGIFYGMQLDAINY